MALGLTASRVYLGAVLAAFVAWVFLFVGPPGGQSLADKLTDSFVVEQTLVRLKNEEGFSAKPYHDSQMGCADNRHTARTSAKGSPARGSGVPATRAIDGNA